MPPVKPLAEELDAVLNRTRPDLIGGSAAWPGDGTFIQTVYFTSDDEATANESASPSSDQHRADAERLMSLIQVTAHRPPEPDAVQRLRADLVELFELAVSRGAFPERAALNQLAGRFLTDFYVMVAHWVSWASQVVDSWPEYPLSHLDLSGVLVLRVAAGWARSRGASLRFADPSSGLSSALRAAGLAESFLFSRTAPTCD